MCKTQIITSIIERQQFKEFNLLAPGFKKKYKNRLNPSYFACHIYRNYVTIYIFVEQICIAWKCKGLNHLKNYLLNDAICIKMYTDYELVTLFYNPFRTMTILNSISSQIVFGKSNKSFSISFRGHFWFLIT